MESQLSYWRRCLDGIPTSLHLPFDRPRPAEQSFRGESVPVKLSKDLSMQLRQMCRKQGITLFMGLMSAYAILLSRYSRQSDIVVGTPVANRGMREVENLIGFFANTLAIRNQVSSQMRFVDFAMATRETCLDAYAHQDIPFEA
jgi:non-ribosomal peptide synthetase component F